MAQAQPAKHNGYWFNRNYILGAQMQDAEGNLMWCEDGSALRGAVESWTGAFNAYAEFDGKRIYYQAEGYLYCIGEK